MREKRERWMQLAEMAANEQDPKKLLEIAAEIIRLMDEKQRRLESLMPPEPPKSAQPPK